MENTNYANAYSEVLEIIKHIPREDYNKIPKQKIELFETNSNKEYAFIYNPSQTLDEQNVSKTAKTIIAILFRDYWATKSQREKIIKKEKYDRTKIEEQKKEKYNPNDIFKNKNILQEQEEIESNNEMQMVQYNVSFIKRIIYKIKELFKR